MLQFGLGKVGAGQGCSDSVLEGLMLVRMVFIPARKCKDKALLNLILSIKLYQKHSIQIFIFNDSKPLNFTLI